MGSLIKWAPSVASRKKAGYQQQTQFKPVTNLIIIYKNNNKLNAYVYMHSINQIIGKTFIINY